jgi:putative FmdB family regulatory protein
MPIYEYRCNACGHEFEELILPGTEPACPSCKSADLERLLSLPALKSQSTHDKAMRAAKKRDAAQGKERMHAQLQYEKSHDRHG